MATDEKKYLGQSGVERLIESMREEINAGDKAQSSAIAEHRNDAAIHVTADEKETLLDAVNHVHEHSNKDVLDQITSTVDIYTQSEEPTDAPDGSVWINMSSDADAPSILVRRNGIWEISSDGMSQVQPDWEQTDASNPGYIRNKPFGYTADLYVNSTLPFAASANYANNIFSAKLPTNLLFSLKNGDNVTIIWDGVTYNLTAKNVQFDEHISVNNALGNGRIVSEAFNTTLSPDTGEPFCIASAISMVFTRSTKSTHSLQIKDKETIIKIDAKFLPDEVIQSSIQSDWNESDESSLAYIKNRPEIPSVDGLATEEYVQEYVQEQIAGIEVSGDGNTAVTETDIFPEQTLTFDRDETTGELTWGQGENVFPLIAGETYYVEWDGTLYIFTGISLSDSNELTQVFIGNPASAAVGEDDGTPFAICYMAVGDSESINMIVALDSVETHTVRIYQKTGVSCLPEFTMEDEGKVLSIKDGALSWEEVSGGTAVIETDIFPEQTLTSFNFSDMYGAYHQQFTPAPFTLTEGQEYIVIWDGISHTQTAFAYTYPDGSHCVAIGNTVFTGEDSGEPFCIVHDTSHSYIHFFATDDATSHTVRIYQKADVTVSWKNITDKPFGEAHGLIDTLPLITYGGFAMNSTWGVYDVEVPAAYTLTIGDTYIVNWDGVEYECVVQDASALMGGATFLGNASAFGLPGNNEPFIIAIVNGYAMYVSLTDTAAGGSHSVRISKEETVVKQLDKKYIPIPHFGEMHSTLFDCSFTDADFIDGMFMNEDTSDAALTIGEIYTVVWNGVTYTCSCIDIYGAPAIGNTAAVGGADNGLPFAILRDTIGDLMGMAGWAIEVVYPSDDGTYSCTISGNIVKKIDTKYLYQPDWNENDISRGGYIKNRPFGTMPAGTIVVGETTVNCSAEFDDGVYFAFIDDPNIGLHTYDVVFDDVHYTITGDKEGSYTRILNDNFSIYKDYMSIGMGLVLSSQGEHTFKVSLAEDVVEKIDAKYLPIEAIDTRIEEYISSALEGDY